MHVGSLQDVQQFPASADTAYLRTVLKCATANHSNLPLATLYKALFEVCPDKVYCFNDYSRIRGDHQNP
jgi:hypothetical protein